MIRFRRAHRPACHVNDHPPLPDPTRLTPALAARAVFGGALMGLANLVPGISGGTMLLACGIYRRVIEAVAELTRLRFRPASVALLALIAAAAAVAILALARPVGTLVVEHRWAMYSLFIGLTLGGVPVLVRMGRPLRATHLGWAAAGLGVMIVIALVRPDGSGMRAGPVWLLVLAGFAGAGAMILPGISGGYVLLVLGQYVPVLDAIASLKEGLAEADLSRAAGTMPVIVPVGLGVVVGFVGVSNLIRALWQRFPRATVGLLLGLLVGAVVGLWPFQQPVPPEPGSYVRGERVTAEQLPAIDPRDWPTALYAPTPAQAVGAVVLAMLGAAATLVVDRLGRGADAAHTAGHAS